MNERVAAAVVSLAEQCGSLEWVHVPEPVRDRTLMVVFDTLGVMLAGSETEEATALAAHYHEIGSAPLVGFSRRTSIEGSCWVNGFSVCSLELDEGNKYARGHPGAHTIPAALSLGPGKSGATWLSSVLVGYEVAARFGRATRLATGVHPHGTWGATGAAAAAARLTDLATDEIAAAIDAATGLTLAPHFESALDGHPVRNLWVGASNVFGVTAARLAAAGLGEVYGTASGTYGDLLGAFDETQITVPFGERFEIMHGYFKRHASCAYTHPAADAVLKAVEASPLDVSDIASVSIETYSVASALDGTKWPTRLAAMFSIPYVVAVVIRDGAFGPSATDQGRRNDPEISRIAGAVSVVGTEEFDSRLPERRGARVVIVLGDGTEISAEVDQPVGDAAYEAFGWDELRHKMTGLIGSDRTSALERAILALEDGSVDELIESLGTV
jgi:2-methylcitrate dehydratase PrpD